MVVVQKDRNQTDIVPGRFPLLRVERGDASWSDVRWSLIDRESSERRDRLSLAVLRDGKVSCRQIGNRPALSIGRVDVDRDGVNPCAERGGLGGLSGSNRAAAR